MPPPPTGPESDESGRRDNGIAVAGLVVSLTGLILSIVVIGGFIGLAGLVMSIIGLSRSRTLNGAGRAAAIGGALLGLFSMVAAIGFAFVISDMLQGDADLVRDGVATRSSNTEFPPQDDIVEVSCEASESGRLALAVVTVENMSPEESVYTLTVTWETASNGEVTADARSGGVEPGETEELRLFDTSATGDPDTCSVAIIDRTSFLLFGSEE